MLVNMWTLRSPTPLHPYLPPKPHTSLFWNISPHISSNRLSFFFFFSAKTEAVTSCFKASNQNHLIQTLSKQRNIKKSLLLLSQETNPTVRTYECLLQACVETHSFVQAKFVHDHLARNGFDQDPYIATKLIDMYSHFNSIHEAQQVFEETHEKTIYVWNALLRALALAGRGHESLALCRKMKQNRVSCDRFTYTYALKACCLASSSLSSLLTLGKEVHGHILRGGFEARVHISTTLIDMYAECGNVLYARRIFDRMNEKNVVSWSAMIACYSKNWRPLDALDVFQMMVTSAPDVSPNSVTMVSVLQSCGVLAARGLGKLVHAYVLRRGHMCTLSVMNALVGMYCRCGSLELGRCLFDQINQKDTVSWNSMISGYGIHGFGRVAIDIFYEMIENGVSPNRITFTSVLSACSHVGLVEEGKRLFHDMVEIYKINPLSEHYSCMVDLLGRAGQLDEAAKMIEMMKMEPGPTVWGSLLGACRIHGNVDLAERASQHLFELEPNNAGNYVLLADIYAGAQMWEDVNRVKKLLKIRGLEKIPGCSFIELQRRVYSFVAVDESNPQIEQIHALLAKLSTEMKDRGYIPDIKVVLYELSRKEKEKIVLSHSEKLALAFGLINTAKGQAIHITKNLRLCEDCHTFTKFISKFMNREIIVRDVNRFHRFRDGICSCGEYW